MFNEVPVRLSASNAPVIESGTVEHDDQRSTKLSIAPPNQEDESQRQKKDEIETRSPNSLNIARNARIIITRGIGQHPFGRTLKRIQRLAQRVAGRQVAEMVADRN